MKRRSSVNRRLGRYFALLGTLCNKLRLLPVAEVSFLAATRLHPDPGWCIALGRLRETRRQWVGAEAAFARAIDVATDSPQGRRHRAHAYYRQARIRVRRKQWDDAEAAFAAALDLRPEMGTWHAHRAQAQDGRGDWASAAHSYRRAAELEPHRPEWLTGLVRAATKAGRPVEAAEAGHAGAAGASGHGPFHRALAAAYAAVGHWSGAAELLRRELARQPNDHALRTELVDCLEQRYLVPFQLDHHGGVVAATAEDRSTAWVEAIDQLRHLVAAQPDRPGPVHRLGVLQEHAGRFDEAADTYRLAMDRMAAVDAWWCLRAAHEWGFRHAYVKERRSPSDTPDQKLSRTVTPIAADPAPQVADTRGFFRAMVAFQGLQLFGFLLPGNDDVVDIYLDDQLLKQVRVDETAWRPAIRFDLTNSVLREFPERSLLSVRAGGRSLSTIGGADALEIRIPGGTGAVKDKLARGQSLTKKGSWPRRGKQLSDRQERYLRVYERARDALDTQGLPLFLCYGTLLGCHREGRFIPGDDDFDVSYVSRARNPRGFRQECQEIALELLRQGLDVSFSINGRLFKVGLEKVWIDITPMWFYKGRSWAFDAHDLDPSEVEPVRTTEFLGRKVYVPSNPEAFLADTYGPDWRTPQPQFRYYRAKEDDRVLSQMWAKPSEVREFARRAEAERARSDQAGRFLGVGVPGYPGFSWLTSAADQKPPPHASSSPA